MKIAAFPVDDASVRRQAAELLVEAFPHPNGWPTLADALEQVDDVLVPAGRCRVALDGDELVGWIGSMPGFRGHPLGFYQRMGFALCGMIPDANGFGLPNLMLARRVSSGE